MNKSIDNVTPQNLDIALRLIDIQFPIDTLVRIIDIVELIEEKGGDATLKDIGELRKKWRKSQ